MSINDNEQTRFKVVALFSGVALFGIVHAINDKAAAYISVVILVAILMLAIVALLFSADDTDD